MAEDVARVEMSLMYKGGKPTAYGRSMGAGGVWPLFSGRTPSRMAEPLSRMGRALSRMGQPLCRMAGRMRVSSPLDLECLVYDLCAWFPLTRDELAQLLHRKSQYVRKLVSAMVGNTWTTRFPT